MQWQNDFNSYCRWTYQRTIADELLVQYFPISGTLLFTKQNGILPYICREFRKWRHTWHYRTARHSQKVQQNVKFHLKVALLSWTDIFMQVWREQQDGTRGILVSCVMCQVPGPGCVFGKLSETSVNFEREYLGISIEISALFHICCTLT